LVIWFIGIGVLLPATVFAFRDRHTEIAPKPPLGQAASVEFPAVTSRLAAHFSCSVATLERLIEKEVPKRYSGDERDKIDFLADDKVTFTIDRAPLKVSVDAPNRCINGNTTSTGHAQLEFKVKLFGADVGSPSIGFDAAANLGVSTSPEYRADWSVDPHLSLTVDVTKARTGTPAGDVDIAPLIRDTVKKAVDDKQKDIGGRIAETLQLRPRAEKLWSEIPRVIKVADNPPVWIGLKPQSVSVAKLGYTADKIESGIEFTLEARASLTENPPKPEPTPLPNLTVVEALSDAFYVHLPVVASYDVINAQLSQAISAETISLPAVDGWVRFTGCQLQSHGTGIMMRLDFAGRRTWLKSFSGRVYLVATPHYDPATARLRFDQLKYTAETNSALANVANYLLEPHILETLRTVSAVSLSDAIKDAKARANESVTRLKQQLPKEIDLQLNIDDLTVDGLAFSKEHAFTIVRANGKMAISMP
jgi:hypothetical protein